MAISELGTGLSGAEPAGRRRQRNNMAAGYLNFSADPAAKIK